VTRRRKVLLGLGATVVALALLAAGVAWFLLASEPGTRFLFTRLGGLVPGELETAELSGPIRGPLVVRGLVYTTETMKVTVDRVLLDWDLRDLLRRQVDVHRLHADGVRVELLPGETEEERGPLPDVNLRFNVIVRDARVRDVAITRPDAEAPLRIDRIALVTRSRRDGLVVVRSLTARGPDFAADARGTLRPQGDYPVDLHLAWRATLPGWPAAGGRGRFTGTLERLEVEHRLAAPFPARVDVVLTTPLSDLAFDGTVEAERVDPSRLNAEWPAVALGGTLHGRGTIETFSAEGDVTAAAAELGRAAADLRVRRRGATWWLDRVVLETPEAPSTVVVQGTVTIATPLRFDLAADWEDLVWPLAGDPAVRSAEGGLTVRGTPEDYALAASGRLTAPTVPPGQWRLAGRGGTEALAIESFSGGIFGGTLAGSGRVAWQPAVSWRLAVRGRGLDPQALWAEAPGSLSIDARTAGRLAAAGPVGSIAPLRFSGTVRGEPLRGGGAVRFAGDRVTLSDVEATWGSARLAADGTIGGRWDLGFRVEAPNLGVVLPDAGGSLAASGRIEGQGPRITAAFEGGALTLGTTTVASLSGTADVGLAPGGPVGLDLEAADVVVGDQRLARVTLTGDGRRDAHRLEATLAGEENVLVLALTGGLAGNDRWRGTVSTLDLRSDFAGSWRLASPAPLAASTAGVTLDDLCWVSGDGPAPGGSRLCSEGGWNRDAGWRVEATLAGLPLSLAAPFLPPDLTVTGDVDGTVLARADAAGRLTADVALTPGPGELRYTGPDGEAASVRYEQASLDLDAGAGGLTARAGLVLTGVGDVAGEVSLPNYNTRGLPARDQAVSGRLRADLADLSFLQALAPGLGTTAGRLHADLAIAGDVARPRVTGQARLSGGAAEIPAYGLELTEVELVAESAGDPVIRLTGGARSGPGRVTIAGQASLAPSAETPVRLAIEGRRFQALDTEEMKVLVSPDLDVVYRGEALQVTGEVVVPEAEIEIKELEREAAVPVSPDVVVVRGEGETPERRRDLPVAARIRLVLGEEIEVRAFGLVAEPSGSLLLVEEPGRPTTAIGEIEVDRGTFKAYGQDLTIERGRLVYAGGPLDNPGVALRAYRRADDGVVAGIEARGRLQAPEVSLWSDPPMGQTEQLSYVLLGRPLERATPAEGSLVANAATALGVRGGNLIAKRVAARFGLEEARIETEGTLEEASLVLGRYLSPRLYVTYGIGLFEPVNTLRLRYLLDERWTLQAESGAETSADVLYTTERGRGRALGESLRTGAGDGRP
jgi:translocation and assembly module TamB